MHRSGKQPEESMEGVRRTLAVLQAVTARRGRWFGVSELSTALNMPKGTLHRYVSVFVEEGILQHSGITGKYAVAGSVPDAPPAMK